MRSNHRTHKGSGRRLARLAAVCVVAAMTATAAPVAFAAPATGSDWTLSSATTLHSGANLNAVASTDPFHAWAAGSQTVPGSGGRSEGVLLRWNGFGWHRITDRGLPKVKYWVSVDASSPWSVYAYGWGDESGEVMAHFDGLRWKEFPLAELPDGAIHGFSEVAATHGRTFMAGERFLSSHAKGRWTTTELTPGHGVNDVDARSARDAWAVGGFAHVGQKQRPLVKHWDGKTWKDAGPALNNVQLTNVYAESARSVWVSGYATGTEGPVPKVLRWDGRKWTDVTGPVAGLWPQALSGDGRGSVVLSGDPEGWEGPQEFWRYRDGSWRREVGARPEGKTQAFTVADLAPSRTGRFWAVGSYTVVTGEHTAESYDAIWRSGR
ncbi:hypothetical protein HUT18_29420 [Streptomyces sp. NA04227]|uniref:hypothetical protein n=1 Tax=Streptomyces sp. NA04227 TaxID=2742136 RepID=UPI0015903AFB|nr:hypothetical protein [Streptomyces sp. NA04227]QKW09919.1 hypothetical protein HUT18_29420 [Streptomyces sp. NA04227]